MTFEKKSNPQAGITIATGPVGGIENAMMFLICGTFYNLAPFHQTECPLRVVFKLGDVG